MVLDDHVQVHNLPDEGWRGRFCGGVGRILLKEPPDPGVVWRLEQFVCEFYEEAVVLFYAHATGLFWLADIFPRKIKFSAIFPPEIKPI